MRRWSRVALAGSILGALLSPPGAMGQGTDRSFVAVAVASGGYATYGIPGFLIVENYVDGGGPISQALLDSSGASQSFASLPYPGETFVKYPGVAAFLFGVTPPDYPLYASASPSQPEQVVGDPNGPFELSASAAPAAATGLARTGTPDKSPMAAFVARAESGVTTEGGTVTARAVSLTQGLSIGPLSVGSVRSVSQTTYVAGAEEPTTTTELTVDGGKVGDVSFRIGPNGLSVKEHGVPLAPAQGLTALNAALEPSGMSVRFADSTRLNGGAAASVFEVVNVAEVPGAGRGTLRVRFGGATSFINLGAREGEELAAVGTSASPQADAGASHNSEVPTAPAGDASLTGSVDTAAPAVPAMTAARNPAVDGYRAGSLAVDDGATLVPLPADAAPDQTPSPDIMATAGSGGVVNLATPTSRRSGGLGSLGDASGPALVADVLAGLGLAALAVAAITARRRTRRLVKWTA